MPKSLYNVTELIRQTKHSEFLPCTFTVDLKMINLVIGFAGFSSSFPCQNYSSLAKAWPTACLRATGGNLYHFKLWQQTSWKLSEAKVFLKCSHGPVLPSPQPVLYLASPPPSYPKLDLTNLFNISNTPSKQTAPTSKGHIPSRKNTTGCNEMGEKSKRP